MQFCKNNLVLQITEILIERHNGNFDKCDDCYRGKRSKREVQDFLALAPNWVQSCDGCTWHLPLSMIFSSSPLLLFSTLSLSFFFQFYFYFNFHYFFFTFTLIFTWHLSTLDDLLQFSFTFILNTFTFIFLLSFYFHFPFTFLPLSLFFYFSFTFLLLLLSLYFPLLIFPIL